MLFFPFFFILIFDYFIFLFEDKRKSYQTLIDLYIGIYWHFDIWERLTFKTFI